MEKIDKFIYDVLSDELKILNEELIKWKRASLPINNLVWRQGEPERKIEETRKRISKIEICIEMLNPVVI